ncbi:MAG: GNAT family N-acetyltransferase [Candidatus Heimdallarchaeota archaeon]|nr:GNAT family N-acetyltransferase [Candidatus Heimdallarchaeota archaeon]MCK4289554.1 GNAT family N-acetyltransferase [Candidatus Heimdallarchaeota archaeon]
MSVEIRKLEKKDEEALIDICFVTGDPFLKKNFPNSYLFALFWCLYYVWYEESNCFVAFDVKTKKVVGYILSTLNTEKQEGDFKQKMTPLIKQKMKDLKMRSIRARLVTYFIVNRPQSKRRKRFLKEYPAHLHIDILPAFQRQGIGHRLMNALEKNLKEKGVRGFHLEVGTKNELGISFYEKYGLVLAGKNSFNCIYTKKITK